ncbi:unnamed protein product [Miscanthus lutarioriparius]|uniref:Protein kinase domain-containing protein n=1 Tax=Miscanthus lutarioriparius TaxID=422564 RepID=A0A811PI68_9POAL|nr:unnamed protein product [Miscanthus lutarioriparius]
MAAQARLRLLSTLTFLVVHAATAAPAAATSCAPRTCGNLTIAYPFWLPDQQPSSSSSAPPLSFAPFTASSANAQLVFLFNCTGTGSPPPAGFVNVTCPGAQAVVRLDPRYNATDAKAVAGDCDYSVVPVMGSSGGASAADYPLLLRGGYLLEWRASPGDCTACNASGGQCGSSSRDAANVEKLLQKYGSLAPKRYRYSELIVIAHKLGEGGYGAVFSGVLTAGSAGGNRAREVAVKFLHHSRPNGEEFLNEVISIGRTSHVNIVTLLGFCLEGSRRALVYEYMPNGSLDRYIYAEDPGTALGWEALQEIAAGIARGLEYLHEGCSTRIIHFDIKPQNVLLDADLRPKIADFGMAKLCNPKESILSMADARGTVGFIAPEVFSRGFGVISTKSDVYSYGMLLLEMVAGRSNAAKAYAENKSSGDDGDLFFPLWVYDHLLEDGDGVLQGSDAGGAGAAGEEIARKMALIGLWCIQTVPASRPSMSRVLEMLERSIHELAMPPRPYHTSPSNSPSPSHPSSYPSSTSDFTQR